MATVSQIIAGEYFPNWLCFNATMDEMWLQRCSIQNNKTTRYCTLKWSKSDFLSDCTLTDKLSEAQSRPQLMHRYPKYIPFSGRFVRRICLSNGYQIRIFFCVIITAIEIDRCLLLSPSSAVIHPSLWQKMILRRDNHEIVWRRQYLKWVTHVYILKYTGSVLLTSSPIHVV